MVPKNEFSIFLIKAPYLHLFKGEKLNMFPIGLATIAGMLRQEGYKITFLDPENQDMTTENVVQKIEKEKPHIVGVGCVSANFSIAKEYFDAAKKVGAKTLLGGNHASSEDPLVILKQNPFIDFVFIGEADATVVELCDFIRRKKTKYEKIQGIAYNYNNIININPKRPLIQYLDALPQPVWDLVDINKYNVSNFMWRGEGAVPLMTSRGYPSFCIYCATTHVNGRKFRAQSAERIVSDIEHLIKTYHTQYIVFLDDIFTIDKERVKKLCQMIIQKKLKIQWFCLARVNTVDKDILRLMKKAGCSWIEYGVESGDEEILKVIKKGITLEQARRAFKDTRDVGIKTFGTFMFGNPTETNETMEKTIQFAIELNPDIAQFSILAPLPGTELWDKYRGTVYILSDELENSTTYGINTQTNRLGYVHRDFSEKELQDALTSALRRFYLRPEYIVRQLLSIRSYHDVLRLLEGAESIFKQSFALNINSYFSNKIKENIPRG